MTDDKLTRMANQIAGFFRSYPEDEALAGIHDHLVAFWTRSMRDAIQAQALQGDTGLDPLVIKALVSDHKGASPIEKEVAGPDRVGQLGSDAG